MKTLIISCLNSGKIHNWIIPQRAQGFINNYYALLVYLFSMEDEEQNISSEEQILESEIP